MLSQQKTLKKELVFKGIGVHSGAPSTIRLKPAPFDSGIVFVKNQSADHIMRVGDVIPEVAMHATVIKSGFWAVSTVEHLMAALSLLGVDNVEIEVDGTEIPILDGSALPFVQGIYEVGFELQRAESAWLTPKELLTFQDNHGRLLVIEPAPQGEPSLFIDYNAGFVHPLNGSSIFSGQVTQDFFINEIAPARTFGNLEQFPYLRAHGLAQGSSLGNTVVIGDGELLNDMRLPDECVRHKLLDLLGDLSLLGKRLAGRITAQKTGHQFNRLVIEHFINNPQLWELR
jgi:UDP-3-O-[3-hydroxymyristoyl] N-acetylglucosamine deacetylase